MRLPIPFAHWTTYRGHSGVDFPEPRGTMYRASGSGVVVSRSKNKRGGYYVWVQYDNGPRVGYHHMDSHAGVPKVGTRVNEGTYLGYVGSLGQRSTGPHLHMEVAGYATSSGFWKFFDPNRVVGQSGGGGVTPTPTPSKSEEDDVPLMVKANVNIYVLSPGQIKLADDPRLVRTMLAAGVKQHDLTGTVASQNQQFADLLDMFGIPRSIDGNALLNGNGWVLNPETKKHEKNGLWSWERNNKAILATKK